MRQRLAQGLGEFGETDRHRADIDDRLAGGSGHVINDSQIPLAQLVRRLGKFGVDDDDVCVGIVNHDLDRFHINGRIDHGGKASIERITHDAAGPQHSCKLLAGILAQGRKIQAGRVERVDQEATLAAR